MTDFLMISTRSPKRGVIEIYPKFIVNNKSSDLMIRGGDFYAIWNEEKGLWSTGEDDVIRIIDRELDKYAEENRSRFETDAKVKVLHMWDGDSGMIDKWHKYCQKQCRDNFHMLDEKLIFSNTETSKEDYASKKLNYPLEAGDLSAYDKLMSVLYSDEERHKIEWAIGSIVSGDSKNLQKFMVLYGAAGTGKSTVLNIIQQLFEGYYCVFDAKALGSANNQFALEAFKTNPLVAIQHDGDLSRIDDNTRLNSLVSHELMTVNEKRKSLYSNRFKCFLFMGTNKPVRITDAKSGLIRRLIDVSPTGNKLSAREYKTATKQIGFELGAIAYHCLEVYKENPGYYDNYIPINMLGASNDFYNFVLDSYFVFKKEDGVTMKIAWEMYKTYCNDAKVTYPFSQRIFREELKNYFQEYKDRYVLDDGTRVRSYYLGFKSDKFDSDDKPESDTTESQTLIDFKEQDSIFDKVCSEYLAQYATDSGTPVKKWDKVKTTLKAIDTSKLHYVKVPENHIVIDFDIPDENGNKSLEKNIEEASKWPATYAELSKSGSGVHLHYIYTGDTARLNRLYKKHVEVKVFTGNSSLRRRLTKCNSLPIATISSGLPLKGENGKMVNSETIKSEKGLRVMIKRNLNKEIHPATKPSIDFIYKILEDTYASGLKYDVTNMRPQILSFAAGSTNHSEYCIKLVNKMRFKSDELSEAEEDKTADLIFYDVEVFPNLFIICWKKAGEDKTVVRMINPSAIQVENLLKFNLVGFNCRKYDNHILYGRMMGYDNAALYKLSQRIIIKHDGFFGGAYNASYTDVYDFAAKKQSLKKWEIELGIHHQELGLPWDEPVPEEMWTTVADYCCNDVVATEAVFNHLKGDFTARQILADLAGGTVNDTTNSLTTKIIFGDEKHPELVYTHLEKTFPEYEFKDGKNIYRGTDMGFGGYIRSWPGIYGNVALLDIQSMHPNSAIAMNYFGRYTPRFKSILDARIAIKHGDYESARKMLDGRLSPYLNDESQAKSLAQALKIAINSVYGLTAANFDNPFRDVRNKNNIVALRGALFMRTLQDEVLNRGFEIVAIKTDSIKIPDATPEIIDFCMSFADKYGYKFEHEATYDRMCQINDADYIARYKDEKWCKDIYGYIPEDNKGQSGKWAVTGKQFAIPYVFKTLFSKEEIGFEDMCETFSVQKGDLYLDMNENLPDASEFEKQMDKLESDYKKGKLSDVSFEKACEGLPEKIAVGHDYHFVGRVGQFCPIKAGCDGGVLYRVNEGKYYAAPGSSGYRWLESEMVRSLEKESIIDISFYDRLVNDAVDAISKYGDFEWFVSDDPYIAELGANDADIDCPPWVVPCGDTGVQTCFDCQSAKVKGEHVTCRLGYDTSDILMRQYMAPPEVEPDELPFK